MDVLQKWHRAIETKDLSILDEILAEDVIFYSPVLWSPQKGKALTKMYLTAAFYVLGGNDFRYVKEIISDNMACLEFTTIVDDSEIEGVDIISINDEGKIIEFKVMVRPIRGMMVLKEKMVELMESMGG
jgi:hypothetical protein